MLVETARRRAVRGVNGGDGAPLVDHEIRGLRRADATSRQANKLDLRMAADSPPEVVASVTIHRREFARARRARDHAFLRTSAWRASHSFPAPSSR